MRKNITVILVGLTLLLVFTLAFTQGANAKALAPVKIKITVGNQAYTALLEQGETADKFIEMMPTTVTMQNTNNREMRYNFSTTLPSKDAKRSEYAVGDIGYLAASRSLVIFYKQAGGSIDNLQYLGRFETDTDVEVFEQMENAQVTFELDNDRQ